MTTSSAPSEFVAPGVEELQPLFPSYRLEGFLAQGGMGAVYKAYQTSLDRPVAIKILPEEFSADESFRESFVAEARAMARMNHPNLIGVYDFGEVEGMLFIVMELVDGKSLHDLSVGIAVEPSRVVELVSSICHGLAHAHEHAVLHRDIKPANILLDEQLRPKIGDFGLARRLGEQAGEDEVVYGTLGYAAPEVTSDGPIDQRADIFSVGVLLHRLLTGVEPIGGSLPPASTLCGCPPALDRIVGKATEIDPAARYGSAEDMARDLDKALSHRPHLTVQQVPVAVPVAAARVGPVPAQAPAKRRSRAGLVAGLVLAVAVTAAAMFFAGPGGKAKDRAGVEPESAEEDAAMPVVVAVPPSPPASVPAMAPVAVEPALVGLARLKGSLAAGKRDQFPDGTAARDGCHYLVVDQAMGWGEAEAFAEEHGAHLAVLPTAAHREWLREQFPIERPLWLGAGLGAEDHWQWIDGTAWSPGDSFPSSFETHRRVAFSAGGGMFPGRSTQAFGLALQWHDDGVNPGTLTAQLNRTAAALHDESPLAVEYPIGTRSHGDSHYLRYNKAMSWEDAHDFAKTVGAYLAVPGSEAEEAWICDRFSEGLPEGRGIWLGGFRLKPGDRWRWPTSEAWHNSGWQEGQPAEGEALNRMALLGPTGDQLAGWVAGDGASELGEGLLLEWSPQRAAVPVASFDVDLWLKGVNRTIASRVRPDLEAYERDRKQVVQAYARAMGRILRKEEDEPDWGGFGRRPGGFRRPGERAEELKAMKENLKEASRTGQLLKSLPFGVAKEFREQQEKSEADLKLLAEAVELNLTGHREYYAEGLRKKTDDLAGKGYLDVGRKLKQLALSIEGDSQALMETLFSGTPHAILPWTPSPEPEPEPEPEDN